MQVPVLSDASLQRIHRLCVPFAQPLLVPVISRLQQSGASERNRPWFSSFVAPVVGYPRFMVASPVEASGSTNATNDATNERAASSTSAVPVSEKPKTAAILLIADELLSGKISDLNGYFLAKVLYEQGVDLKRIVVVPDQIEDISSNVLLLSKNYDYVFTSGGIGPTHDDVTYDAIAYAFKRELKVHEETRQKMTEKFKRVEESDLRMVTFPEPCEKLSSPGLWVPLVVVENVYILPGVPFLFKTMIEANKHHFVGSPKTLSVLYSTKREGELAPILQSAQDSNPGIAIGSYPHMEPGSKFYVKITIEGRDKKVVEKVVDHLTTTLNATASLQEALGEPFKQTPVSKL